MRTNKRKEKSIIVSQNLIRLVVPPLFVWVDAALQHRAVYSFVRVSFAGDNTISFHVMRAVGASKCRSGPTMEMRSDNL